MLNIEATNEAGRIAMTVDRFITNTETGSQITPDEYAVLLAAEEVLFEIRDRGIVAVPAVA